MTQDQINSIINRLDKVQPNISQWGGDSYKRAVLRMAIHETLKEMAA